MARPSRVDKSALTFGVSPPPVREPVEGHKDRGHLDNVKTLGCLLAGFPGPRCQGPIDPHHLKAAAQRGPKSLNQKHRDRDAVPLCQLVHHAGAEGEGPDPDRCGNDFEYFARKGIDARGVADGLWSARGDLDAMRDVVDKARSMARLKTRKGEGDEGR